MCRMPALARVTGVTARTVAPVDTGRIVLAGNAAMNAIAAPKPAALNRLEGLVLTALFLGFPAFAPVAPMLKLFGSHEIVGEPGGAAIFVVLASLFHALITPWLAPKFSKFFRQGYEPLFFDASLSFSEKIARWRVQPQASLQLVTSVLLLSLLAVAVGSIG